MIDVLNIAEIEQTEVDPRNHATTIHTALMLPDGGEGFLIIGRVVRSRKQKWLPLKDVISKVIVEYDPRYHVPAPAEENSIHA